MKIVAFEKADPNDIAQIIVGHIIKQETRPLDFKKQMEGVIPDIDWNESGEKGQWGAVTKKGYDINPPKLYIIKKKERIEIPKDTAKNWAKLFVAEGVMSIAPVWVHEHIEGVYSKGYHRDLWQWKRGKAIAKSAILSGVDEAKRKIFETCVVLAGNDAPKGLKDVMVNVKGSKDPFSLGDVLNYNDTKDKKDNSVLGKILKEFEKLLVTGDAIKKAIKLRKQAEAKYAAELGALSKESTFGLSSGMNDKLEKLAALGKLGKESLNKMVALGKRGKESLNKMAALGKKGTDALGKGWNKMTLKRSKRTVNNKTRRNSEDRTIYDYSECEDDYGNIIDCYEDDDFFNNSDDRYDGGDDYGGDDYDGDDDGGYDGDDDGGYDGDDDGY